jgi:hypothetical protein
MSHIEADPTLLEADPVVTYSLEILDYVVFVVLAFAMRKIYKLVA